MSPAYSPLVMPRATRYVPPTSVAAGNLSDVLPPERAIRTERLPLFDGLTAKRPSGRLWWSGDPALFSGRCVAIVGTRNASSAGLAAAAAIARDLARSGVIVVSGLATGIDTAALAAAIEAGGRVVAVIGTPLDRAYPSENGLLQEIVYRDHLLVSPFEAGSRVFKSNFPMRNRVMAALSDATVVVEASDTSGTLHQARECVLLDRWLFIAPRVLQGTSVNWQGFLRESKTRLFEGTPQLCAVAFGSE